MVNSGYYAHMGTYLRKYGLTVWSEYKQSPEPLLTID